MPEASVWLWATAGAAGMCSQLQRLAAFDWLQGQSQAGGLLEAPTWQHPQPAHLAASAVVGERQDAWNHL